MINIKKNIIGTKTIIRKFTATKNIFNPNIIYIPMKKEK